MARLQPEYPSRWDNYCELRQVGLTDHKIGFQCADGDVNRFANRYRIARGFSGISFEPAFTMQPKNVTAYSMMLRVVLAFSAWEILKPRNNDKYKSVVPNTRIATRLRKRAKADLFLQFVANRCNKQIKQEVNAFLNGGAVDLMFLAGGVRHIFAHGYLTANANGTTPTATRDVCTWLADHVLQNAEDLFDDVVTRCLASQNGTSSSGMGG